jgi:hypothetical protein
VKGFDEYFFRSPGRDRSMLAIQWAGYKIFSCPQSIVYHVGGGTLPKGNSQKVFLISGITW